MRLKAILVLFIVIAALQSSAQNYNMGNLGTVTDACGGNFYDSQGPGTNYLNNEYYTATFCAPPGQYITFNFTAFQIELLSDWLDVYNGPTTASPLIGSYTGGGALAPGVITSTLGGCITFVFESDGNIRKPGWEATITCSTAPPSTGNDCGAALPFCTNSSYVFPNNTNQPNLGAVDCLLSTPNPVWYYMQIANPGNLNMNISQTDQFGLPIDIDFDLWGPFTSASNGCAAIYAGTATSVDCSYSMSASEQANIVGAQTGEFYIILLTNYSNASGSISFSVAGGSTASTDCAILCGITDVTANPSACVPATNTYSVSGQVSITNPPATGSLVISSSCGGSTTINAPFGATVNYTINGITASGSNCNVTASFSADATCNYVKSYLAPANCASTVLNCPAYASASASPNKACAGQVYYLDVANTACNGTITMTVVGNYGSAYANEITWQLVSNLTGTAVAIGGPGTNGANINSVVGPLNPTVYGTVFTLYVNDAYGDGFNGAGGTISVVQNGSTIGGPIIGNFGSQGYTIFGANIAISPAVISITTPTGVVTNTVTGCNNFHVPLSLQNSNFCNTVNVNLPWTITCQSTGAILSSGSNSVTIYPSIPTASSDLVDITYNNSTCQWSVSPKNDCIAANIGTIFTISPNPATLTAAACTGGNQTFNVTYNGISGGPNCCSTGGPLIPITYNQTFTSSSVAVSGTPFGGINNAALLTIPPNAVGGNATSLNFTININNYCYNNANLNSYWVTILVDGVIVSDVWYNLAPVNNTVNLNLATLPNGYNQNSTIQVYIYPNAFSAPFPPPYTVFLPNGVCGSLANYRWTAQITSSINATFADLMPTAGVCSYSPFLPYSCCSSTIVTDGTSTICSGGSLSNLTSWQAAVAIANTTCIVYSSVLPIAGTVLPDALLPTGINLTANPINQIVSAYAYCDADGSSTINAGDTYTLISTYTLTVNPVPTATISGTTTICGGTSTTITFNGTPNATVTYTINGGANQTIVLDATGNASLASGNLIANTTYALVSAALVGPPVCDQTITGTAVVTIAPPPIATFGFAGPYCKGAATNPLPTFIGGGVAGVFSASSSNLNFVDVNTGEVNLATSLPGTYTVSNTIAAAGGCLQIVETSTVIIIAAPVMVLSASNSATACFGVTGSTILVVNSSSFPIGFITWSPASGLSGTVGASVAASPPVNTVYTAVGTAANGCTSSASQLVNTVLPSNAGSSAAVSVCSTGATVNLFASLGGTPQATGTWSGPSALSGGNLGTFDPTISLSGVYSYMVLGNPPCPNVTATITVSITTPIATSISYPGSPYCTNFVGSVNPVITGTAGGTFISNPAGLSLNSAGVITPSTSTSGTYTVTYQVPTDAGCAAYDVTQTVVINDLPANPTLIPANPCSGPSVNFTANGGSLYEFLLNGVSQGAPSATNTSAIGPLVAGDVVCVNSYPPLPINFNGLITEAEWGTPIATSAGGPAASGFGVGNNLDALYLKNSSGFLYGALAGNVVNGSNNRILLFIDCQAGGFNSLGSWTNRNGVPYASMENLNSGITFDAGFSPEYILAMNQAAGNSYFDLYNMVTNTNNFLGDGNTFPLLGFSGNTGTGDYSKGFEFAFPLAAIGSPTISIKAFAMLVNDPGIGVIPTTVSNQFITPCGPAELNYGNGVVNFAAALPNPIVFPLSADCYSQACVTVENTIEPTFSLPSSICSGALAPSLPTTADNGIAGTWSPTIISNTVGNSYTFTPSGGCAVPITISIIIDPLPTITPIYHD